MKKNITSPLAILGALALIVMPFTTTATDPTTVSIMDNFFSPQNMTVQAGTTVTWMNTGLMAHTVTSDTNLFDSGTLHPGARFTYTFTTVGTFRYYCRFHGGPGGIGMSGIVTVVSPNSQNNSNSNLINSISGTVISSNPNPLVINQIIPVNTIGVSDGTFQNGWRWIFDVTVPFNEQSLMMRFGDWLSGNSIIPAANNMRFFSSQSSNAFSENTAIYINAANTYSSSMFLVGNLGGTSGRHIQITVETRIPIGTPTGTYSANFGIQTNPTLFTTRSINSINSTNGNTYSNSNQNNYGY